VFDQDPEHCPFSLNSTIRRWNHLWRLRQAACAAPGTAQRWKIIPPSRHRVENEYDDENDFREKTQIATTLQFLDTTGCVTGSRFVLEAGKDRMLIVLPDYLEKLIFDTGAKQQVSIGEKDLPVVCCSFYNLPSLLIQNLCRSSAGWKVMKVTILTVYSNANVVDDIEELVFEISEADPQTHTELNIQRFTGGLTAEWFHPELGDGNLEYRERLYQRIRAILPSSHLAIIEDEESQEIMTIGDLSYFKNVIQQAKSLEELEEVQERIDQTEIGNPLLRQILSKSYQTRLNSLNASA
jgi:hypothetical protein